MIIIVIVRERYIEGDYHSNSERERIVIVRERERERKREKERKRIVKVAVALRIIDGIFNHCIITAILNVID